MTSLPCTAYFQELHYLYNRTRCQGSLDGYMITLQLLFSFFSYHIRHECASLLFYIHFFCWIIATPSAYWGRYAGFCYSLFLCLVLYIAGLCYASGAAEAPFLSVWVIFTARNVWVFHIHLITVGGQQAIANGELLHKYYQRYWSGKLIVISKHMT